MVKEIVIASRIDRTLSELRRRDILAAGAGLAMLPGVAWAERGRRREGLVIGFGREALTGTADATTPIVDAGSLAAGDPRLARGVRLTLHGLLGDIRRLPSLGIRSAELTVSFPAAGKKAAAGSTEIDFRAWAYQLLPVAQYGSPISFTVPVDDGLALGLEVETFGNQRFDTVLTTGREPGVPKLRAGDYLIALGATEFRARRFHAARSEPMISFSVEPLV